MQNAHASSTGPLDRFRTRLRDCATDRSQGAPLIVAFGDSVTEGSTWLGVIDFENAYHQQLRRLMSRRFPRSIVNVMNAGIGGQTAAQSLARLERDVVRHQPDLVIVGFALNDSGEGHAGIGQFRQSLHAIIEQIGRDTKADMILLTPNFMNRSLDVSVAPEHRELVQPFADRQNSGVLAAYAQTVCELAGELGVALADVHADWRALADGGFNTDRLLSNGLNHPCAAGHTLIANRLMHLIDPAWPMPAPMDVVTK